MEQTEQTMLSTYHNSLNTILLHNERNMINKICLIGMINNSHRKARCGFATFSSSILPIMHILFIMSPCLRQ